VTSMVTFKMVKTAMRKARANLSLGKLATPCMRGMTTRDVSVILGVKERLIVHKSVRMVIKMMVAITMK